MIINYQTTSNLYIKSFFIIYILSYGLGHIGRVGSVTITLAVTIDRYLALQFTGQNLRIHRYLLRAPIIFTVLYNIPKFLEFQSTLPKHWIINGTIHEFDLTNLNNYTVKPSDYATQLRNNPLYVLLYLFWSQFLLIQLVPFTLLIALNVLIWRRVWKLHRRLTATEFEYLGTEYTHTLF